VRLIAFIRRTANENPTWGEERIANELLLKSIVAEMRAGTISNSHLIPEVRFAVYRSTKR
jgi:hypothetical protein